MVKFLTPIQIYFYCSKIMDKNLSLNPHPAPCPCKESSRNNSVDFPVSHSNISSLYTIKELCGLDARHFMNWAEKLTHKSWKEIKRSKNASLSKIHC